MANPFVRRSTSTQKYTVTDEELNALLNPRNAGVTQPDVTKLPKVHNYRVEELPDRKEEAHVSKKQKALLKAIEASQRC